MNTATQNRLKVITQAGTIPEARGQKIASIEPVLLSYRYPNGLTWSGGTLIGNTAGFVRIRTHDGLEGIGETYSSNYAPEVFRALVNYFAEYLIGEDPSDISGLWRRCWSKSLYWGRVGVPISVLSAVESALWDLCGKITGKPAYELLGGAVHEWLPRYASGGMGQSLSELHEEQTLFTSENFRATKIRTGFDAKTDRERVDVTISAVGDGVDVAVDAVQGSNPDPWTSEQAIEVGRNLEGLGLIWFEEPCAADDIEGHASCRRELNIPIAGAETLTSLRDFDRFLEADALDIIQPDAAHCGGLITMRQAAIMAEAKNVTMAVHAWGSAGTLMSNYHVAFASPNARWLEFPTKANPLVEELLVEPLVCNNGLIRRPTAPGLGLIITPEVEEKYAYDPECRYRFEVFR